MSNDLNNMTQTPAAPPPVDATPKEGNATPTVGTATPAGDKAAKPVKAAEPKEMSPLQKQFASALEVMKQSSDFQKQSEKFAKTADGRPMIEAFTSAVNSFKQMSQALKDNDLSGEWKSLQDMINKISGPMDDIVNKRTKMETIKTTDPETKEVKEEQKEVQIMSKMEAFFTGTNGMLTGMKNLAESVPIIPYNDLKTAFSMAKVTIDNVLESMEILTPGIEALQTIIQKMAEGSGKYAVWTKMVTPDFALQKQVQKLVDHEEEVTTTDEDGNTKIEKVIKKVDSIAGDGKALTPLEYFQWSFGQTITGLANVAKLFATPADVPKPSAVKQTVKNYIDLLDTIGPSTAELGMAIEDSITNNFGSMENGIQQLKDMAAVTENISKVFSGISTMLATNFDPAALPKLARQAITVVVYTKIYKAIFRHLNTSLVEMYASIHPVTAGAKELEKADKDKEKEAKSTDAVKAAEANVAEMEKKVEEATGQGEEGEKKEEEKEKAVAKVEKAMPTDPWTAIPLIVQNLQKFKAIPEAFMQINAAMIGGAALAPAAIVATGVLVTFLKFGLSRLIKVVAFSAQDTLAALQGKGEYAKVLAAGGDIKEESKKIQATTSMKTAGDSITAVGGIFVPLANFINNMLYVLWGIIKIMPVAFAADKIAGAVGSMLQHIFEAIKEPVTNILEWMYGLKEKFAGDGKNEEFNPFKPLMTLVACMGLLLVSLVAFAIAIIYGWKLITLGLVSFGIISMALIGIIVILNKINDSGVLKQDGMKALMWFIGDCMILLAAILLLGIIVLNTWEVALWGLLGLGVLLGAMAIVIWLANKVLNPKNLILTMIGLALGALVLMMLCGLAAMIYVIGSFVYDWGTLRNGIKVVFAMALFVAALGLIGAVASSVLAPALLGLGLMLGAAALAAGIVAMTMAIGQMLVSLGEMFPDLADGKSAAIDRGCEVLKMVITSFGEALGKVVSLSLLADLALAMPAIAMLSGISLMLFPVIWMVKSLATMTFYNENTKKEERITQSDIRDAMNNLNEILRSVGQTVIDIYNNNKDVFDTEDGSPIKTAFDSISKIGGLIYNTAHGLKAFEKLNIDKAKAGVISFFSDFGTIVNALLGGNANYVERFATTQGEGKLNAITNFFKSGLNTVADGVLGKKVEAPIQKQLDALAEAYSDDNVKGINNVFNIIDRWQQMVDKLGKKKKSKDVTEDFSSFSGLFAGPTEDNIKNWDAWGDSVEKLADNLENCVEQFENMAETLDENNEKIAKFVARIIELLEEKNGINFFNAGANNGGDTAKEAAVEKKDSKVRDILSELNEMKGFLNSMADKLTMGVIKVDNPYGHSIQVEIK